MFAAWQEGNDKIFHLIINVEDEEPFPVIHPSLKKVWTAPKLLCHMDTDTEQLLHLLSCLRKKPQHRRFIVLNNDAEKLVYIKALRT